MATKLRLRNYKLELPEQFTLQQAKSVIETVNRGLWNTAHGILRDNVASLRLSLREATELTADLRQQVKQVVAVFNQLDVETLNQQLLDDKSAPKEGSNSSKSNDSDESKSTTDDDQPEPIALENVMQRMTKLEERVDGHDRRHEQAEQNLRELNGAVGITKGPDGTWKPTPDGQFSANSHVQQHLGYRRNDDGKVSFTSLNNTENGGRFSGWVALATFGVVLLFMMHPNMVGASFVFGFVVSVMAAATAGLIAGNIGRKKTTTDEAQSGH